MSAQLFHLRINLFTNLTADPVSGTVNVKNASASASGTYRCTASNRVGTEDCILQLKVTPRKSPNNFTISLPVLRLVCIQMVS